MSAKMNAETMRMASETLQGIERAIETLTQPELQELCRWLDEYTHPLDARIQTDLEVGRLDEAIQSALGEERNNQVRPL